MIRYGFPDYTTSEDFWKWYGKTDASVSYSRTYEPVYGDYGASIDTESAPATPKEYIAQKREKIGKTQVEQRNARIKQWEDKRKVFR